MHHVLKVRMFGCIPFVDQFHQEFSEFNDNCQVKLKIFNMDVAKRQDLPPPGGYKPINFKRIPARSFFSGWALIGGYLGMTAGAAYLYYLNCKVVHQEEIEARSVNFAIYPMLLAERDREYLKQLRRNRDAEAELMKNVEGWKVGTWFGEPIYKNHDVLIEPTVEEYYIHTDNRSLHKRAHLHLWS